jgi:hypothetical protein
MIGGLLFGTDKPGKDTNSRGMIIFNDTLYITKGSGGNGINTVYQVGSAGTLPTGTAADLANVPITILPGFPNTTASTSTTFPFGDIGHFVTIRSAKAGRCFAGWHWRPRITNDNDDRW